ncbi:MAG TPA: RICIN domain-containing protein [Mycobacteriales bacterium]|nr:RICIN domain-containing protein [Mycobacteriales bacterium]
MMIEPEWSQRFVNYTAGEAQRLTSALGLKAESDGTIRARLWLECGWAWLVRGLWAAPPNGCRTYTATFKITFPDGTDNGEGVSFPGASDSQTMDIIDDARYPAQNGIWHMSAYYGVEMKDVLGRWGSRIEVGHTMDFTVSGATDTGPALPTRAHIVAGHVEKVLNVSGAAYEDGARADLWDWANVDQQKFTLTPVGDGYYKILAKHSGKALGIADAGQDNGHPVEQWYWLDYDNQKFRLEPVGGDYYKIIAKHSGKALTVGNAKTDNGTEIQQWDYEDQSHQKWQIRALTDDSW